MTLIAPIKDPNVTIDVRTLGTRGLVVSFAGSLAHRDPASLLVPLFEQIHQRMLTDKRGEARVDLRELRFMNSSSFKHFVSWVKANGGLPVQDRYKIVFVLSPAHHWQEVSIHALSCFSADEIQVERA